ncbi:MAG: PAS domain-containing sensor histidine kinase [Bacteroidetes bacterium]|jgi:PAS domain S-box-containing protein|nr:PAS domain-containing sensor histidine kinase [Bacteroidota bacterium]
MNKEKSLLDALFEHATEGIIICNERGIITMINPAGTTTFGYDQDELLGQSIDVLLPKRVRDGHHKLRESYNENPAPRKMGEGRDLFGARKDGSEIMVAVSLSPFETTQGKFVMAFVVDITSRKRNESDLLIAHEQLRQSADAIQQLNRELEDKVQERTEELADAIQQLAESKREVMLALEKERELNELKSRFVTMASHEFRTPLGTILSSASLIGKYETNEHQTKREKHIDRIKAAVSNLTEILNDFLSLEKLEEGVVRCQMVRINGKQLLTETIDDLKGISRNGQTIELVYEGNEEIFADPQLMKNILINLVSNAIKYSKDDGQITVSSAVTSERFELNIADRGIGIPLEDQKNIFDRFFRATNAGNIQGTGLGLNIVKKYVELMDGSISFVSSEEGTTFTVSLPQNQ